MSIIFSIVTTLCIGVGFYFGFVLGKTGELPKIKFKTRAEIKQEKKESKKALKRQKEFANLDSYDGTSESQEDIS